MCVPDDIKNINVRLFHLMSRTNETRHIKWHEMCKCKYRLDASVCNNRQRWNENKCRKCKQVIDKCVCHKRFIWNPSNCKCEWNKSCDVGEYLDYENCKFRKRLVDKLVEIAGIILADDENKHKNKFSSCALYFVLFSIIFTINIGVGTYFIYYKDINRSI